MHHLRLLKLPTSRSPPPTNVTSKKTSIINHPAILQTINVMQIPQIRINLVQIQKNKHPTHVMQLNVRIT